ncbi:hypothetical protein HDV06_005320 [Boothiomyces sp. JEL0866]|nr:hypothetical protein HDV06_005320 [Boothiomyces sp. JEL0866]
MEHSHRSSLKQQNKPFKSKHASKGALKTKNKGKVNRNSIKQNSNTLLKQDRRNQQKLLQQKKRMEHSMNQRMFSGMNAIPKNVLVVGLCPDYDKDLFLKSVFDCVEQEYSDSFQNILNCERFKQRLNILTPSRNILSILNALKISDLVVFVLSSTEEVDEFGEKIMSVMKIQGIPNVTTSVQYLTGYPQKKQLEIRKSLTYYMNHHFPGDYKLYSDEKNEALNLLRFLTTQLPKGIQWRERRPYLLAEDFQYENNTLRVTGYVRGNNLKANHLIHIPEYGDFQIGKIYDTKGKVLDEPNEERQDLVDQNEPDLLDQEQTWPTDEEIQQAEELVQQQKQLKRVPKGTSSYQASWILEDDQDGEEADDDIDIEPPSDDEDEEPEEYETIEMDNKSEKFDLLDDEENQEQLKEYLERQKESRDEMEFPDEVDTPQFMPASQRFSKYRGLKSFRNSPWDPYENLPIDYSRIFQFQNFKRSKKKALDSVEDGISVGTRVVVEIVDVPESFTQKKHSILALFGLLPYEQKISVLNFCVQRQSDYTDPVKSKDPMILMCGFRTLIVSPIYSTFTRGGPNNVFKFNRYLLDKMTMGTIYAPVQYGPAPVLMFKYSPTPTWDENSCLPLVGSGTLLDPQPLRIIAKRVVLTGHPYKIHKRGAVIRFMFFNPQDVDYFRPVQLVTKLGRTGHVKESLGTHGYMKCIFDAGIKAHDTICMNLYKRVFPKWNTRLFKNEDEPVEDFEMQ